MSEYSLNEVLPLPHEVNNSKHIANSERREMFTVSYLRQGYNYRRSWSECVKECILLQAWTSGILDALAFGQTFEKARYEKMITLSIRYDYWQINIEMKEKIRKYKMNFAI